MKITLKPSLEHIALVKIVVNLWRQNGVTNPMEYLFSHFRNLEWKKIENSVTEKVSLLPLPQILKEKLSGFIKPIGLEILKWIEYHCSRHHLPLDLAVSFCWTPQGTIDRKKTVEVIVKDDNFDICMRYKLACLYCIEDDILELRNKIPDGTKLYFPNKCIQDDARLHQNNMILHWSDSNQDRLDNTIFSYQQEFEACAKDGNKEATYYFYQKLTPTERDESLLKAIHCMASADFIIFLVSLMNEEQEAKIFQNRSSTVLERFLDWPFQSLFVEMANHMMDFLSSKDIRMLISYFVFKEKSGYKDCNYKRLFGDFLKKSSSTVKRHLISNFTYRLESLHLILITDKENLKFLLQDASISEKKNLIYSENGKDICEYWIYEEEWDFLGFFIQECLPSNNEIKKFKEKIEGFRSVSDRLARNKHKWDHLFSFPGESDCN